MTQFYDVCKVGDIPEGEARMFVVNQTRLGVFHVDGEYFALNDHCPHAGASLAHGFVKGDLVSCRIHHWRFCIRNGTYLDEDKPKFNARSYSVRLVGEQIQVEI